MKALSIKQPWASLIAHGIKDIENRTWKTKFRGTIYIHASAKKVDVDFSTEQISMMLGTELLPDFQFGFVNEKFIVSAIIGEVDIIDCVINHPSIWAEKSLTIYTKPLIKDKNLRGCNEALKMYNENKPIYNWVLANAKLYDKPILNVKGKLSFWETDVDIVECIGCGNKFDSETMKQDDEEEKLCVECWEELFPIMK